jgi:hypothetical protein
MVPALVALTIARRTAIDALFPPPALAEVRDVVAADAPEHRPDQDMQF